MKKLCLLLLLGLLSTHTLWSQWAALGGPDTYGYTWKTSDDPNGPTYDWIDIRDVGTELIGLRDDNVIGPIPMGLDFQYYWTTRSQIYVGSNGYLSFQNGNIASSGIGFPLTPSPSGPNDVIAPFMCDLTADGPGNPAKVYYYTDNQNQRFIVSYIDIGFWEDPGTNPNEFAGSNTFQVILDASDSTVTFQYQKQIGSWNASYNQTANPMVVGIENITGRIGLLISNSIRPLANTAVRFTPPAEVTIDIADIAPISLQNPENGATFVPFSASPPAISNLQAVIGNLGNVDVNFPTNVTARVRDSTGQVFFQQQLQIPSLAKGATEEINFSFPFVPLRAGPYTFSVDISNPADINAGNNSRTVEINAVDTSMQDVTLSYSSENIFNIINPNAGTFTPAAGFINWTGGEGTSGAGVLYEFYGYPIIVKALEFFFLNFAGTNPSQGFIAELYAVDPTGASVPGQLLFRQEVPFDSLSLNGEWTRVNVPISQGVIAENGFYVGYIQVDPDVLLITESVAPISARTYEILDGNWAQYRNNSADDLWVRAVIDISNLILTKISNKFDELNRFEVYPNPTSDKVRLEVELSKAEPLAIKLMDMQGRKLKLDILPKASQYSQTYDLSHLPKGIYLLQISTKDGQKTKRIVKE